METPVRTVEAADRSLALGLLSAAFTGDPVMRWLFPNPRHYLDQFEAFADAFGGAAIEAGHAHIAGEYHGAALWLPPGVESDTETMVEILTTHCSESALADIPDFMTQMEKVHPEDENCWYLAIIGVDPCYQGRGIGSALLKQALKGIDEQGGAAYLEASTPQNAALYQRHGFELCGTIQSGHSPEIYPMLRTAR
jgi:ribosomal protein S18 acetylase RimI-like enzyme